uniref:Uncharacterized protein n=1 Tax=Setaria italica TaxID=4555 RepID=K3XU05_SETIT
MCMLSKTTAPHINYLPFSGCILGLWSPIYLAVWMY